MRKWRDLPDKLRSQIVHDFGKALRDFGYSVSDETIEAYLNDYDKNPTTKPNVILKFCLDWLKEGDISIGE